MCRTGKRVETIMEGDLLEEEVVFMGEMNTDKEAEYWSQELELNKQAMCFKLDTGAAVTAIPKSVYSESRDGLLKVWKKKICGPNKSPLKVIGTFVAEIKKGEKKIEQEVYVISDLIMPLLGLPAIQELQLIQQVAEVQDAGLQYKTMFPSVFTGLGQLQGSYKIKLADGARPYALSVT